ncbi:MAG: bifunctional oligoribonuclease/PAP phosphatase NrnA [Candidatus Omnitrophota bacterium]
MSHRHALKEFCQALRRYDRFLLTCHVHPEGDAIGTVLAMDSLLRRLGKKTAVVCQDSFPNRLSCLSSKRWNCLEDLPAERRNFDAVVLADCPNTDRLGEVRNLIKPDMTIFNLDHHVSNSGFGHYNYVVPTASATGEVLLDLFGYFRLPVTREEATNIYVAVSTDTGSFRYGNASVKTHQVASRLIRTGIDIEKINEALYATYSLNKLNLYSRLLGRVRTALNGQVAWVILRQEDLRRSGAIYEDTEGFIDMLRLIREVVVAFVVIELPGGKKVKVSFRSKGSHDVNRLAVRFGGGGHKKAAACVLEVPAGTAQRRVLEQLAREFPKP